MPPYQTDYSETHNQYYEGMIINPHTCDISTYVAGGEIKYGAPLERGTGDNRVVTGIKPVSGGTSPFHATDFYGISVLDPTRDPERGTDEYNTGDNVSVVWRGDVVVKAKVAVSAGGPVSVDASDNGWDTAGAAAKPVIPGARYLKDAAAGELTIIRLYGSEQRLSTG